jgi:hypothetical protein
MAIQLTAITSKRDKKTEAAIIAAAKHAPIATAGGRTAPRELTFQLRSRNDAIATRMRIYLHMKKLGQEVTVKIVGMSYAKKAD